MKEMEIFKEIKDLEQQAEKIIQDAELKKDSLIKEAKSVKVISPQNDIEQIPTKIISNFRPLLSKIEILIFFSSVPLRNPPFYSPLNMGGTKGGMKRTQRREVSEPN